MVTIPYMRILKVLKILHDIKNNKEIALKYKRKTTMYENKILNKASINIKKSNQITIRYALRLNLLFILNGI